MNSNFESHLKCPSVPQICTVMMFEQEQSSDLTKINKNLLMVTLTFCSFIFLMYRKLLACFHLAECFLTSML